MSKRTIKGKVVSDKMQKTVVVAAERIFAHPRYGKRIRTTRRYLAHNDLGAKMGDKVMIEETRPISKNKCWRVVKVVEALEAKK